MNLYTYKGTPVTDINICRLLSELEGAYQLLHYMGFDQDRDTIDSMKKQYYKLYYQLKKK